MVNNQQKKVFQKVTTNFTGLVRNDRMEEKDYLVAPMIMLLEGVHEGSEGPLYYPAEEIAEIPAVWNHKPVIVYHPQADGRLVSACNPDILTNRKVGLIMNTTVGEVEVTINKKKKKITALKAEAWLEVARMNKVDKRIAEAVAKEEVMELSTGLWTDNEKVEGEWNGETYTAIARNYRPDHLALLPDLEGACSIEDGAGFLRLNEKKKTISLDLSVLKNSKAVECLKNNSEGLLHSIQSFVENEISFDDIRRRLQSIIRKQFAEDEYIWIEDVFDDYFVYEREGNLYKQDYNDVDGSISLKGLPKMVTKKVSYEVESVLNQRKDNVMDKSKTVDALIENESTKWTEDDKDTLMGLEEDVLAKMSPVENTVEDKGDDKGDDKSTAGSEENSNSNDDDNESEEEASVQNMSALEYIDKKVPAELQGTLRNGLRSYNTNKAKLVELITANKKSTFTKEQLEAKDLDELKALATLAANTDDAQKKLEVVNNYSGQMDPVDNTAEEEEPMDVPQYV